MERHANYLLVQARDRLELTVTPAALAAIERLRISFGQDPASGSLGQGLGQGLGSPFPPLSLSNTLGPGATALLTTKAEKGPDGGDRVLARAPEPDDAPESAPASPHASPSHRKYLDYDVHLYSGEQGGGGEDEVFYCDASHQDQAIFSPVMHFPPDTISSLYKKVTDLRLAVNVEGK